jgi:ABC-2 type transport system ATP-binding protein
MQRSPAVRGRGIRKSFGDVLALDGVDLDVASVLGSPVGRTLAVPDGVAGFVDGPGLYPSLTARQNLTALLSLRGHDAGRAVGVDDALEQVGLTDVADDRIRGFSLGMRQRLGLAAALLTTPRLLVLDEPANGLDPAGKRHVHRVITRLAENGTAVVLSSHRMDDLAALCSEVTLLSTGRVVFSGPVGKLAAESGELAYRVRTSDRAAARQVALNTPGLRVVPDRDRVEPDADVLVVRGPVPALDELVVRLVHADVAVRELAPVVTPLEAAFLALTGTAQTDEEEPS